MRQASRSHHRPRPSGCIARSKELERDRITRLSVEERILLALSLRDRFAGLERSPRMDNGDDKTRQPAGSR